MLVQKPERVMSILISDIENASFSEVVWSAHNQCDRKQSLQNVTSLSDAELVEYVKGTPLFESMVAELEQRGVNTDNIIRLYSDTKSLVDRE
jgi:predicted metal-dependent phosphotriesterase family hydrolase